MARRRKPSAPPAAAVVNGRRLSALQHGRLKLAARAEAAGRGGEARRLLAGIESELSAAEDAAWLDGALAEITALEHARGCTVERAPGRVRVEGRDGLLALYRRGGLSEGQYVAGMRYRGWFEAGAETMRSTLDVRPGGTAGLRDGDAAMDRLRGVRQALRRTEQAVTDAFAAAGRPALAADALMVLREVAGLGRSLRDLSASGARREALKQRLGEALAALA